jgi:hypothetical protein
MSEKLWKGRSRIGKFPPALRLDLKGIKDQVHHIQNKRKRK